MGLPVEGDTAGRRHSPSLGNFGGGFEQFREIQLAVIFMQPAPGIHRTGDGHRMGRIIGDLAQPLTDQSLPVARRRRPARTVEGDGLCPRLRDDGEAIAADSCHGRLDHHRAWRSRRSPHRRRCRPCASPRSRSARPARWEVAIIALRAVDGGAPGALEITVHANPPYGVARRACSGCTLAASCRKGCLFACMNANSHCAAARGCVRRWTRSSTAIAFIRKFPPCRPRPTRPHYVHMQGSASAPRRRRFMSRPPVFLVAWNRAGEPDETSKV